MRSLGLPSNGAPARPYRQAANLSGPIDVQQLAANIAPFIASLADKSALEQVEVLEAKIANQTEMRDRFPEPIRTLYVNNLRILRGKLKAAKQAAALEREDQASTRTWRFMGYTVTGTGIAVGVATVVALLSLSRSADRTNRHHGR